MLIFTSYFFISFSSLSCSFLNCGVFLNFKNASRCNSRLTFSQHLANLGIWHELQPSVPTIMQLFNSFILLNKLGFLSKALIIALFPFRSSTLFFLLYYWLFTSNFFGCFFFCYNSLFFSQFCFKFSNFLFKP